MKRRVTISWSGGKDSAFALYKILLSDQFEVVSLHTIFNKETGRVGMHGVPEEILVKQAEAIGLPLLKLYLERSESHSAYEQLMKDFYQDCAGAQICGVVFGDIFLEDLKAFRENLLIESRLESFFPLWKSDTKMIMRDFIHLGFKTFICSANTHYFSHKQLGETISDDFIKQLPDGVDACGENGEFHTFVYDGPVFRRPVEFKLGEVVQKKYSFQALNSEGVKEKYESAFWFQDLLS